MNNLKVQYFLLLLRSFCDIIIKRIIAHIILIISVLSIRLVFAGYYGNVVKAGTMSFGQYNIPNDTITITVTNPGDRYLWIRSIYINEKYHNVNTVNSYIFDANGYFYYSRIVPQGRYGVIRLSTASADLIPKDGVYNVKVITNAGVLKKSFLIENSTFQNTSILDSFIPYFAAILFTFYVGICYYRRFQIPE